MHTQFGLTTRVKMNACFAFVVLFVGSAVGYNLPREAPYNVGRDPYYSAEVNTNYYQEPSQRLFWGEQGSNQVGGTGIWATLTNKFPFLGTMFGRMELSNEYGVPSQYNQAATQYGPPGYVQNQYQQPQYQQPQYQYQQPQYQVPQFFQQVPQQFGQRFAPAGRDVGFTDDAVIVTPPFVPIAPQPVPVPAPAPAPVPIAPAPAPQPQPGYNYDKPQYRLELPQK